MNNNFITVILTVLFLLVTLQPVKSKEPIYLNTSYSFEERSADLVSRLTLEEKQTLLGNTMSPIDRKSVV